MAIQFKDLACRCGLLFCMALLAACSTSPQQQGSGIQENRSVVRTRGDQLLTNVYTQIEKGDLAAAEKYLQEAREQDPANPYVALNLGVIYQRTGRPTLAMDEYAKVLSAEAVSVKAGNPPLQVYWRSRLTELVQANMELLNKRSGEKPSAGYQRH